MAKKLTLLGLLLILAAAGAWLVLPAAIPQMDATESPARSVVPAVPAEVPVSYASIPISLSIDELRRTVSQQLSEKVFASNVKIPKHNIKITVEKNGPFAIWVRNDTLRVRLPIKFEAEGDLHTHGELTISSSVKFGINDDWQPDVKVKSSFEWDWQPRVGFWPFRIRIGDRLAPYIQKALDKGSDDLRQHAAESMHIRELAEAGWKRMHVPRQMASDPPVWLSMQPQDVWMEPITSDKDDIHLALWMGSRMSLVQGDQPAETAASALPLLNHGSPKDRTYSIPYLQILAYADLAAQLKQSLVDKAIPVTGGTVIPKDIELFPSGNELVLRMTYVGQAPAWWESSKGAVYFTGTPDLDLKTRTLKLENFHLTAKKAGIFGLIAGWVAADDLSKAVEQVTVWDLSKTADKAQSDTAAYLNRTVSGAYDLWGTQKSFDLQGLSLEAGGIGVHYLSKGEMSILFVP